MRTLKFPNIDSEVITEVEMNGSPFNLRLTIGHYVTDSGGLSEHDAYLVALVKRVNVEAVDGRTEAAELEWADAALNKMLRSGEILAIVEERLS